MDMDDLNSWFDSNYQNDSQKFIEKNSLLKSLKDKIISSDKIMKLLQTKTNESAFLKKKLQNLAECLKQKERTSQELRSQVNNLLKGAELNKKLKADHELALTKKDSIIEDLKLKISYIESENKIFRESSEAYLAEKSKLKELVSVKELAEKKHSLSIEKKDKRIKVLTQNFEGNKQMLLELREKFNSLQKEMHKLKEQNKSFPPVFQDTAVTSPPPNLPSRDDEIARIISEMTLPIMLSPIPSEHNEEDDENSFCSLPDQNGCDDGSVDHFAEMLETEFLKGVDADSETNKVQDAVMLPNDNSCHLLQSPQNEDHLQVNPYQINENGINTTTIVCDKNSESGNDHLNAEQGCMKQDLEDGSSKQFESVPGTAIRTDVIQINDTELLPRSGNINSGDVSTPDSVTYHNVAYNYTDTMPSHGETLLNDKINTNPPAPRKCSNLFDENLKKSKENKEQDIISESLVEYQNDNDNKCDIKCGYNSDCSKANSNKILENHIAKDLSQTADNSKFDSVTFHEDAYNNTETLSVCGVTSLENEIDANLSVQRKCSDSSEGTLKISKDRKKRNIHKESLAKNQNDNDRNKSNTMCGYNSDYNKMNSKEVLGNHIEENSSETVDIKIGSLSAKIPAITKDLSEADLRLTISETFQLTQPPHHQNDIINYHHSQNNSQTLDTENFKDENLAVKNILDDKSLLHEFSLSKDDKSSNLSLLFNKSDSKLNNSETHFNNSEIKVNNLETKVNNSETEFNNSEIKFSNSETRFSNSETKFNNSETKFIDSETQFNDPKTKFNNPETIFNNPETKFNDSKTTFNNPETKSNNPETKFNNPETKFNNPETIFNNPETNFNNPETKFHNPETKFHNPETKFHNSETKFHNSETKFHNSETKFNNPETKFNNPETKFNDSEIKFNNSKKTNIISTSVSLPKISEIVIANNEMEDLNDRTSLVSNEPAALKLQEKVCTEINNGNTSSEEFNDFSDDSLDLDYNTSKKVGFQRNSVEYVADGEIKERHLIKIEHSYALETMNDEDSLIFSDSLSEQEIDSSLAKCYTTKPKPTTFINDLFGICSSDSESEKQFSNSDIPLKSVNNSDRIETSTNSDDPNPQIFPVKLKELQSEDIPLKSVNKSDRIETSTNSDDPNSQIFPVKLKELQSEEKTMPEDKNLLIRCDSFNTSLDVDDNNEDSQLSNFSIKTNMEHKKVTATGTACGDIKENSKPSQKVEEAPCIRTNVVNNKPSSHIKCSVTFLQHSTSLLDSIKSKSKAVENGKNNSVSSKQLGFEQVVDFCHNTEKSQSENIAHDTSYPKIFARESNETTSSNDSLTLIEEFILVAPLITPFPDTLEFIKKHSSHTDTVNSKYAVDQISTKSSVENPLPPHLSINFRKRPTENSILPNISSGNKNHVNSQDSKYPDEPVLKSSKQTPVKVFNLSHNLSSDQNVPSKISATFAHRRRLLNKSRSLNRSHHLLLSKKTGQLKEFKKESHITAVQTTEKLTKKQVQFESISDLKLKKAEEIKKCFVKAGEVIGDNSVTTSESKLPETSNVDIICKSVGQKKHKRLKIDKTSEDSTEEQLHKRQCKENRVIAEKTRSASHKVERELVNYWKSLSSPPSGTIEKIFNSRLEPALIINSLVLQIVKLLEASQYEMVQWYYIHSNAGQPTPYLSEKETRLFQLISVLNDRPDVNEFIPKLCDSIQKAVYNYGKESNHLGRWSLCRVYIALCRLQGHLSTARIFFYNTLCQLPSPQYMLFALTVSATWPLVLTFNREGGQVTLPQVIEHVVVNSIKGKHVDKKILRCLHKLCGWTLQAETKKNEVPRQLLAQLQGCLDATMSRDDTFRLMKGIELLSLQENWSWTNSLIRNRIGPLLKKYLSIEEPSESVTTVLSFILEMLGNLYLHGQTRDKTACYAVNYLLKPLLASKKVPQQISLCCANVLLKLFPFDPGTVYPTLEIWLSENPTEITSSLAETWATIKHKINNFRT
ncbi:probable serine/threonine-protein kinase DDB_G0282963 isoform X2 [Octopus sinensis]|uniref:Probable serine/threonine-protein kinase DDB_G0282963 isoform X2 n=1 Tax=Octopus sinensis TaxID=2607531 RepID=A0A7E6ENN8_9MOLL|nr:probable serine/threonine-protein kinase DDB_G0282963 isoform X2 [Octopus sinensis]